MPVARQDDREFLRYCPERELPDEIKQLPKDEVVCKFCGVSYLIHHEIKELQKRLKYLETCSSQLEECKLKEKKLLQKLEEEKAALASQNAELNKSQHENTELRANLQQINTCIQEKDRLLKEKNVLLGNVKKQFSETLCMYQINLVAMKTDISTTQNQMKLLSKSNGDIISTVKTQLKQRLAANEALSLESISQLKRHCSQLSEHKEKSEAENKRLVNTIHKMESQYKQSEEENKSTISELRGELNELSRQLTQTRNDTTAEKLAREDLECKLRVNKSENSRLTKLLSDKTTKHVEETEGLQSRNNQLETALQSTKEELARLQTEYNNVVKDHYNTKTASNEAFEIERRERVQLLKEKELMIESHQNRLQELQEHFKAEKQKLEEELMERQKISSAELDELKRSMDTKLAMELSKASQAAEREQEKLVKSKATAIQQLENKLNRMTEKHSTEVAELKEQLRVKQLENDAELTAHIHQVKELELKLKQMTEDAAIDTKRRSQRETVAVQVDTMTKQLTSLEHQLELQDGQCVKLSEELEKSHKEVEHLQNTVHLECRERIELTEALEQAREQLLTYKMKDKMTVRPISGGPVPPPQSYHGNTLSSLNQSRQRIAQVTGRVSKTDNRQTKSGRF